MKTKILKQNRLRTLGQSLRIGNLILLVDRLADALSIEGISPGGSMRLVPIEILPSTRFTPRIRFGAPSSSPERPSRRQIGLPPSVGKRLPATPAARRQN